MRREQNTGGEVCSVGLSTTKLSARDAAGAPAACLQAGCADEVV